MLIFRPHERHAEAIEFEAELPIIEVERIVGTPLEQVPGFLSIEHGGVVRRCVAFGARGSTHDRQPLNVAATIEWDSALRREMGIGLIRRDGRRADHLTGPVVVLFAR
jgi:hypothetical protein